MHVLMQMLMQFENKYEGGMPKEIQRKKEYAAWKASDINKALREGRTPRQGGPSDWHAQELEAQDVA